MSSVFDHTTCKLGEGPIWHPERKQLFWFDIMGKTLLSRRGDQTELWQFDEHVSAAGWIDKDTLLIASETALFTFDFIRGKRRKIVPLEEDMPLTRSNDGRADPWGGFWIGTMGKNAEPGAGSIYRLYGGELRQLLAPLTITNSICFAPDRSCAYFADTSTMLIQRVALDPETGWPNADPEAFVDLMADGYFPDGSVVDAAGNLWNAQWGSGRIAGYAPDGSFIKEIPVPASQVTCPAFGGEGLRTMYATSATVGLSGADRSDRPLSGQTFAIPDIGPGQPENQVIL